MEDAFPLVDTQAGPVRTWRLSARDHGGMRYLTPRGGEKLPTLVECQDFAAGKWPHCSVWALNDATGELWMRGAEERWERKRAPHDPIWFKGKSKGLARSKQGGRR